MHSPLEAWLANEPGAHLIGKGELTGEKEPFGVTRHTEGKVEPPYALEVPAGQGVHAEDAKTSA